MYILVTPTPPSLTHRLYYTGILQRHVGAIYNVDTVTLSYVTVPRIKNLFVRD